MSLKTSLEKIKKKKKNKFDERRDDSMQILNLKFPSPPPLPHEGEPVINYKFICSIFASAVLTDLFSIFFHSLKRNLHVH